MGRITGKKEADKQHKTETLEQSRKAIRILDEVWRHLAVKLAQHVVEHAGQLRAETFNEESYGFALQQLEEKFLGRLSLVDRALSELQRMEQRLETREATTTFEAVTISANDTDLPQKIADLLAENASAEVVALELLRAREGKLDMLVVFAREDKR